MTPHQIFTIAALGSAAGVLALGLLLLLGAAAGVALLHGFEHLHGKRLERQERRRAQQAARDLDTFNTICNLPPHDPRNPQ